MGIRGLIEMADAGEISLAVSEPMIEEVLRVLKERFQWSGGVRGCRKIGLHRLRG